MTYLRWQDDWRNFPDTTTPVSGDAMDHIEAGLVEHDSRLRSVETSTGGVTVYADLIQEVVDRQVADGRLQYQISRRYEWNPAVGIPEIDLADSVKTKLNPSSSGTAAAVGTAVSALSLGDWHVSRDAGIAETKLALATDAAPAVSSRRTLGTGSRQALPGDTSIPLVGAQPADHSLSAWSFDPANAATSATVSVGVLQLIRLWIPRPVTITGVVLNAVVAGSGLTNCYVALYSSSKTLLSQSADRSSAWSTTAGDKKGDLASPQVLATSGYVYAAFWVGGGTSPSWACSSISGGGPNNLNLTGTALRFATANTGLTTTAPTTAGTQTGINTSYLVGLY